MDSERRKLLSAAEVRARLPEGWRGNAASIEREYSFSRYQQGVDFAVRVAQAAEKADHHPDILIGHQRVKVTFWTHDAGGVTSLDLAGAASTDGLL